MSHRIRFLGLLAAVVAFLVLPIAAEGATKKLRVSSNGRFLAQEDGKPFFWLGDTNWRLYKLSENQIDHYLDDRKAKNFNVVQGPVLLHQDAGTEWTNANGDTNTVPAHPSEAWFAHIDYIVHAANARGIYVALVATWGDMWDHFASNNQARQFGKWLGQRYKNCNNVIWIVSGEYLISGTDAQIVSRWNYLGAGLAEGSGGNNLITAHGSYQSGCQSSSVKLHSKGWLDFNMIQSSQSGNTGSGADNWNLVTRDWNKSPFKPTLDGEANYERLGGWSAFGVRRRAYWSVFAGAFGHTYGANGVCISYRGGNDDIEGDPQHTWDAALNYPAAADMQHLRRLIESRPMLKRIPCQAMLLSNAGSVPRHIQATRDSAGRYAMVYVPQANKQVIVDMSNISGSTAKTWWFNPRDGTAAYIGSFPANGVRTFTTPAGGPDWILVLDDKSKGYPKPGTGGPLP